MRLAWSRRANHGEVFRSRRERSLLALAALFVLVNALTLTLVGELAWFRVWGAFLGWLAIAATSHLLLDRFRPARDPLFLPLIALLSGWGLLLIARLAENFLWRQLLWLALAHGLMLFLAVVPHNLRWLRRYRYTWLLLGLLLLGATLLFGVNPTSPVGARLWLPLPLPGGVFFQPSELLKLLLIIFLASYLDDRQRVLRRQHGFLAAIPYLAPLLLMWGFCMLLLVWQQDLGAASLFLVVFLALLYLATGNWRYVLVGLALLLAAGVIGYFAFDLVAQRVEAWWNPWPEADNRAFQIVQSLYALASGGLFGQGIAQGFPDYVPVVHSDFAFAAIAEEWGLIGGLGLLVCFAILTQRGLRLAARADRPFRLYMAAGIVTLWAVQALLILGGVTKLLPLTGVTLPFVSYGGSSLLMSGIMAGLLYHLYAANPEV